MYGLYMKYFVLNPRSKKYCDPYARASRAAMRTYADRIENIDPALAEGLRNWAGEELYAEEADFGNSEGGEGSDMSV